MTYMTEQYTDLNSDKHIFFSGDMELIHIANAGTQVTESI